MGFFNTFFRNKNRAGAIGIIGGADGPTAIYNKKDNQRKKEEHEKFLSYAAEKIIPCKRTFKELEDYLVEKYQATLHTLLPHELNILKANVILNHFDDVLDKPEPMGENPTSEEIKAYLQLDTSFLQAREYPAEKLGLEFRAYKLHELPSKTLEKKLLKSKSINSSYTENDVIVEIEMKSEYLCICNGDEDIINDLLLYRGVSEKDIIEKSPRFIAYAYALRHIGKL